MEKEQDVTKKSVNPDYVPTPICPHCGINPLVVNANPFQMGMITVLTVFCAACLKVVSMFPVGMQEPRVVAPDSPIVRLN